MFAFSFRHMQPKKLIIFAALLISCGVLWEMSDYSGDVALNKAAVEAEAKKAKGLTLTKEDSTSITSWEEKLEKKSRVQKR